jgi:hypothetical protein
LEAPMLEAALFHRAMFGLTALLPAPKGKGSNEALTIPQQDGCASGLSERSCVPLTDLSERAAMTILDPRTGLSVTIETKPRG